MNLKFLHKMLEDYFDNKIEWNYLIFSINAYYGVQKIPFLIKHYIQDAIKTKDSLQLEYAIFLIFEEKLNKELNLLEYFNNLLIQSWHKSHENLIILITELNNIQSIPFLVQAFDLYLDYLEYDDCSSFHNNLIWAIYKIGGCSYIETLKLLKNKVSEELRLTINNIVKKCD